MQQAYQHLLSIVVEQKQRVQDAQRLEKTASQQLEDARVELQRIRSEAFERLAGASGSGFVGANADGDAEGDAELPPYSAS